jgi:hypothetical protein
MLKLRERSTSKAGAGGSTPARAQPHRHQVHFWIGGADYEFLRSLARHEEETISRVLRRLIRELRNK